MMRTLVHGSLVALAIAGAVGHAQAQVPDPGRSTAPAFIYVVGSVNHGAAPDPVGTATVVIRDFANEPAAGALVTIDFSGCCDIALCSNEVPGQIVDCATRTIRGYTNTAGEFTFTVMGAARDPGDRIPPDLYGGCGANGVHVYFNLGTGNVEVSSSLGLPPTAVCLDQNGGAGRSNGTTGSDVSAMINLFGAISLGAPYKGRGDINGDGAISAADVTELIGHMGRLVSLGGVGCTGTFCGLAACP